MFEKKRGKRFLASVMALVMLLSLAPVGALAADEPPTTEESSAVALPAEEGSTPAVVDTKNTNENTPTEPAKDSDSAEATKSEGDFDERFSYADADTSDNDNGIAAQNLSLNEPAQEQSITAEYWVTNRRVTAENSQSKIIKSEDVNGATGKFVSELAPPAGTYDNMDSVFWQARVLSGNDKQTEVNNSTSVNKGTEITTIKFEDNKFKYQTVNDEWKDFDSNRDQLVFYYLIHTNFVKDVQINISDWPLLDHKDSQYSNSSRFVRYEIYDSNESSDKAISYRTTWYNQARTISSVQVTMNENDEYQIDRIDCSYTYNDDWSGSNATSGVGSTFSIALNQDNNQYNAIVRIYVTKLRHELTVEYKKNTSDAPEIQPASKFYQLTTVNCEDYFNSNFDSNGILKEDARVTAIGDRTIYRDVAGYRFNHATISGDKKTLTFYYDQLFKVTYNANGGTGNLPTEAEYVAGDEVTVASQGDLKKTGYTFAGWKKGNEVVNGTFTMPAQNVTLTAQWTKTNPPIDTSKQVTAMFFINLGGKDASKPDGSGLFTHPAIVIDKAIDLGVFSAHATPGYGNKGYIFNKEGVKTQYPSLLNKEPTFEQINEKIPADKKGSMSVGDNTGREVVWYHVSDCTNMSDGYHVDGYIKNVAIKITYNPNNGSFDPTVQVDGSGNYKVDGISGTTYNIIQDTPTRDGYTFTGWKLDDKGTLYKSGDPIIPTGDVTLVAQWRSNTETLTYHENFGETEHTYTISVDKDSTQTIYSYETVRNLSGVFGQNTGSLFDGWTVSKKRGSKETTYRDGDSIEMSSSIDLYAQWKQARVPYTINQHFINEKNQEITTLANSQYKSAKQGTVLDTLITKTLKENKKDSENNVYVYIADKTTFKVGTTKVESIATLSSKDTVIDLYYYLDNWKDGDSKTPTKDDSATGGDGIPDCYQVLVKYQSGDLSKGKIADTARTQEVLTIKDKEKNVYLSEGQVVASGSTAEATGSRCYFSNWTDTTGKQVDTRATLEARTFDAVGGKTYTFTANFDRSSGGSGGSSRPSTPTVTIPDNVPTGLNGTDHYAYIIGYGNNDVRPQNNITRAEVATIFFRLLTDETREANMTKSNSYNDVKDGDWFCCAVSTLSKMGIIKGYEDGSFKPNAPISRAEFAAIAARFDPDGDKTPATFADVTSHWAKDEISIAANHGWIKGYEDGSFKPDQKITRAETMTLVNRVLNRLPESKDDLHKDMKTWVDNMDETAWYYLAVQEATNSHYFKNKTSTKFEQWTDLRDTRDWSELEK